MPNSKSAKIQTKKPKARGKQDNWKRDVFLLRQGRSRKCEGSAGDWALLTSRLQNLRKWARLMLM